MSVEQNSNFKKVNEAVSFLKKDIPAVPKLGLVLGSGLGGFADTVEIIKAWNFSDIPHFPTASVIGHKGRLLLARHNGRDFLVSQGRIHYYEGHSLFEVTLMMRIFGQLGLKCALLTNAAGGMGVGYKAGDFMIIKDQINLTGLNALIGPNENQWGPRFPDMSQAYDLQIREQLKTSFKSLGMDFHEGVYGGLLGPTYETPAEVRYLQKIGCEAVGMSTVQECIIARHMGVRVGGISLISNLASGLGHSLLTHEEVTEMASTKEQAFVKVLHNFIENSSF